jgi:hypothetical protein
MKRRVIAGVGALLVAVAAVGCSSSGATDRPGFATTPQTWNCGLTPGTAGTFRPQLSYCEY